MVRQALGRRPKGDPDVHAAGPANQMILLQYDLRHESVKYDSMVFPICVGS